MAKRKSLKQQTFSTKQMVVTALIFGLVGGVVGWAAFAAPHKGGGTTYTGSFVGTNPILVTDNNGDGQLNYGDTITYNVTSNATYYYVAQVCTQNGTVVNRQTTGFYVGWPWSQDYKLNSTAWTGGAADCTATLEYQSSTKRTTTYVPITSITFHVNA
ncbi:MAG TPA: hypothetical protein VFH37_00985 [Candidatus Saccharimonadales bacterium]|nr:hypothetical protein [Candidatus Saccharimonadales bacterium]